MTLFKVLKSAALVGVAMAALAHAQSVSLDGKNISVKPAAAAAGAVATVSLHTEADIVFKGATVSKGDYTLSVVGSAGAYQLVVNKAGKPVAKVAMVVTTPATPPGAGQVNLMKVAAMAAKIEVGVQGGVATAQFKLDRVAANSEW